MKEIVIENDSLKISNGAFVFTKTDVEFASRIVTEILQVDIGEDPQDLSKGLNYQEVIFNGNSSSSDIYADILKNMLKVDGVESVESIDITQELENLNVSISFIYNGENVGVSINV